MQVVAADIHGPRTAYGNQLQDVAVFGHLLWEADAAIGKVGLAALKSNLCYNSEAIKVSTSVQTETQSRLDVFAAKPNNLTPQGSSQTTLI